MTGSYRILGATGEVGSRVLATMRARGMAVKGGSRDAEGPDMIRFDLLDPTTFGPVFEGATVVMLISRPGDEEAHVHAEPLVAAMATAGVRRVATLSALGAERREDFSLRRVERLVEASGMSWTHVRPNFFMQVLARPPLSLEVSARGTISLPLGEARIAYVDAEDVAAVMVEALTDETLVGRAIDVNGPEALDHHQIAATIGRAIGRPVRYAPLDEDAARRLLESRGFAPPQVERVLRFYALARIGWCASTDVETAGRLGRPLTTFDRFAASHASAWGRPVASQRGFR